VNPDRAIVGMAVVFAVRDRNDGDVWYADEFAAQIASGIGVPMWLEHRDPAEVDSPGVLGTWRAFAAVAAFEDQPAGLLTIGEFGHSPAAEFTLERVQWSLRNPYERADRWGLSVTAFDASPGEDGSIRRLKEVSLVQERYTDAGEIIPGTGPAFEKALVMEVGPAALDAWRLLTGTEPPTVVATTKRTVRGRLLGIANGKRVYEEWEEDV